MEIDSEIVYFWTLGLKTDLHKMYVAFYEYFLHQVLSSKLCCSLYVYPKL